MRTPFRYDTVEDLHQEAGRRRRLAEVEKKRQAEEARARLAAQPRLELSALRQALGSQLADPPPPERSQKLREDVMLRLCLELQPLENMASLEAEEFIRACFRVEETTGLIDERETLLALRAKCVDALLKWIEPPASITKGFVETVPRGPWDASKTWVSVVHPDAYHAPARPALDYRKVKKAGRLTPEELKL